MDNNHPDRVMVFLGDLGHLSYKEQLHWRSFNVASGKMSHTAFARSIKSEFADPENVGLYFKQRLAAFQENWERKFSWPLFLPMDEVDGHHLKTLHVPLTNEQKEFDDQVLALTKLFIDSLNEAELAKGIAIAKKDAKGLDKLEAFLSSRGVLLPTMIEFLRKLQGLRSASAAHRKGDRYEKVKQYFSIGYKEFPEVLRIPGQADHDSGEADHRSDSKPITLRQRSGP